MGMENIRSEKQAISGCFPYASNTLDHVDKTATGGGRKGGGSPKTAKPHRNTPNNRKPNLIYSRVPKPHVHGSPLYES